MHTHKSNDLRSANYPRKNLWLSYAVAIVGTGLAILVRSILNYEIGYLPRFITFYPVVFAASVMGGTRPGLVATVLSALAVDVLFGEPIGSLALNLPDSVAMVIFVATNVGISSVGGMLRKQADALRESEALFRITCHATGVGVFDRNLQTNVNIWTPELEAMHGLKPGEFGRTGEAWEKLVYPEDWPKAANAINRAVATFQPVEEEWRIVWPDGSVHWVVARFQAFGEFGKPPRLVGINIDISDRKKAEEVLVRQAQLINLCPAATIVVKPDLTICFWSKGAESLYGWTAQEAVGRRAPELFQTESFEPVENIVARLRHGGVWSGELAQHNRKGQLVIVESFWLAELNPRGELEQILESNTDITSRKHLQEHLEDEVDARTAELRETISELEHISYSMIHDMRAPLRAMQSFAHILEEDCVECQHPPGSEYLKIIRKSAQRLDRLITDALSYSRVVREEVPMEPVEISSLLRGIIDTYPNLQPNFADITVDIHDMSVLANESLLTQAFGNLLDNAVKFVAAGVRPTIHIWAEEINGSNGRAAEPPLIKIWFEDNGIGIRKDVQDRIFRLFQRMHREEQYPGTGIGLAIVKKAVERMHGRVGLESEPGKGSKFWIELPKAIITKPTEQLLFANDI